MANQSNQRVTIVHQDKPGLHYGIPAEKYDQPGPDGKSWRDKGFVFANPDLQREADQPQRSRKPSAPAESAAKSAEIVAKSETKSEAAPEASPAKPGAPQRREGQADGSQEG